MFPFAVNWFFVPCQMCERSYCASKYTKNVCEGTWVPQVAANVLIKSQSLSKCRGLESKFVTSFLLFNLCVKIRWGTSVQPWKSPHCLDQIRKGMLCLALTLCSFFFSFLFSFWLHFIKAFFTASWKMWGFGRTLHTCVHIWRRAFLTFNNSSHDLFWNVTSIVIVFLYKAKTILSNLQSWTIIYSSQWGQHFRLTRNYNLWVLHSS